MLIHSFSGFGDEVPITVGHIWLIAPFCGCDVDHGFNGKGELDVRQHVGASVLVSPWWRVAPQGGVRHEVPRYVGIRLYLTSCDRVGSGFRSVGSTPFGRCWYPCSIAGGWGDNYCSKLAIYILLLKLHHRTGVPRHLAHYLVLSSGEVRGRDHSWVPAIVHSVSLGYGVHGTRHNRVTFRLPRVRRLVTYH